MNKLLLVSLNVNIVLRNCCRTVCRVKIDVIKIAKYAKDWLWRRVTLDAASVLKFKDVAAQCEKAKGSARSPGSAKIFYFTPSVARQMMCFHQMKHNKNVHNNNNV